MASGFQIAFLVLAFQFGAMLATRFVSSEIGIADQDAEHLAKAIWISLAVVTIASFPKLREDARRQLSAPIPADRILETWFTAIAKVTIPFAVVGALAIWVLATDDAKTLSESWTSIKPFQVWGDSLTAKGVIRNLVLACFVGPIVEEIVFRGWLFRAWERQWGWRASMIATAIAFGLCHPSHVESAAFGSIVFTAILLRTGSLRACIVVHCVYNFLVQPPLFGQIVFRQRFGDYTGWQTWSLEWACLAFVAVALPAYLVLAARTRRDKPEPA